MIRRCVFIALLVSSPAFASIRATAERELTLRELDIAESGQSDSRIASDGTSFLTVWQDARIEDTNILGARLAQNGAVLDATPLVIGNSSAREWFPAVAWGRDRYLVVWSEGDRRVLGRFVFNNGTMSDATVIGLRGSPSLPREAEVAFNGRVFLVVWSNGGGHLGTIVGPDGRTGPTREIIHGIYEFDLVAMGSTFYFVYKRPSGTVTFIEALPVDEEARAGAQIDIASTPPMIGGIHAAARDDDFLVSWTSVIFVYHTRSARVAADGVRETWSFESDQLAIADVVVDSGGYLLLYGGDPQSMRARRPGSDTETILAAPAGGSYPRIESAASGATRTIALVRTLGGYDTFGSDLFTTVVGENSVAPLVLAPRHQTFPEIASAGDTRLVVWTEYRVSEGRAIVAAAHLDANGNRIDGVPIEVGSGVHYASRPRVASNGTDWLVTWESGLTLFGRRIRHDGTFIDAAPLELKVAAVAGHSAVEWDGTSYVVVASFGLPSRLPSFRIVVRRVPAAGEPAPELVITPMGGNFLYPALAAGPNGSLLVWSDGEILRGVLLSTTDTVTPLSFPAGFGRVPSVAWNRDTFLVATDSSAFGIRELRWLRVDASGNASEALSTINVGSTITPPRVEPFGDHFLLLWNHGQFFAAVLDRAGNVIEQPAAIAPGVETFAAEGGQVLTARRIEHPTHTSRVFLRMIEWTPETVRRRRSVRF